MCFNPKVGIIHGSINMLNILGLMVLAFGHMLDWWDRRENVFCQDQKVSLKAFISSTWIISTSFIGLMSMFYLLIRAILAPWFIKPSTTRDDYTTIGIYLDSKVGRFQNNSATSTISMPSVHPLFTNFYAFDYGTGCITQSVASGLEVLMFFNKVCAIFFPIFCVLFLLNKIGFFVWKVSNLRTEERKRMRGITKTVSYTHLTLPTIYSV
eukprot:TRINITY_DN25388_c0_g1_i1.p1 TRINITY_DN25388_c0_g1~~TRINITY_DN25388_c0_g1_i1.p1  ORF type:complete len:210 (-),score=16.92 TRINITY_DN25388_c0_g1_i1:33-662(-)